MANLYNRLPSITPLPGYYKTTTPTELNTYFGWRYRQFATIGFWSTILGYLLDRLPWDSVRHTAIVGYSTFNIVVAPTTHLRLKTVCLHASAATIAILLHHWYPLNWVVSTYLAIVFYGC
jgi:hypothetical protein